jgi:purine-binding chemotaxis protein CheW
MNEINEMKDQELNSFLTFILSEEHFAIEVMKVKEILEVPKITAVPRAPNYLKGVVNLRGNVLPVIDTRIKFKMEPIQMTIDTCIVVMEIEIEGEMVVIGALVDSVYEVIELKADQIKQSPSIGSKYNPEFIEGVVNLEDHFIMLLNIGKVFSIEDVEILKDNNEENSLPLNTTV